MRAIWKGSISFGLVSIPISLYRATHTEDLKFRLLRKSDLSPVTYKRVAEVDGKEVPWSEIVKGYEYEKNKFVVIKDEDFKRVDVEATQTVDIMDFVELDKINPMFFNQPYYMEPQKGADKAYSLIRDALTNSRKVGIAKVVIKTRQYLAAVKPQPPFLLLELMHFADELADIGELKAPKETTVSKQELQMAQSLIDTMTDEWEPGKYIDDYRGALLKLIEERVASGGKELPVEVKGKPSIPKVVDLLAVLQESLDQAGKREKKEEEVPRKGRRKAA